MAMDVITATGSMTIPSGARVRFLDAAQYRRRRRYVQLVGQPARPPAVAADDGAPPQHVYDAKDVYEVRVPFALKAGERLATDFVPAVQTPIERARAVAARARSRRDPSGDPPAALDADTSRLARECQRLRDDLAEVTASLAAYEAGEVGRRVAELEAEIADLRAAAGAGDPPGEQKERPSRGK